MAIYTVTDCKNCGIDHEWQFDAPTLQELWMIKEITVQVIEDERGKKTVVPGMNGFQFFEGLEVMDPAAMAALLYILHKRDKITIPFRKIDLDITKLNVTLTAEEEAEADAAEAAEGQAEANPTPASGPRRRAASKRK